MATTATTTNIRVDDEVRLALIARMKPQETYNDVLRRVLTLDAEVRS